MSMSLAPGSVTEPDERDEVAFLLGRADVLSSASRGELLRRLTERQVVLTQDHATDLAPVAGRHADKVNALRLVARALGHPPLTTEYTRDRGERIARGEDALPSVSALVRAFDGWPRALIAAGLVPNAPVSAYGRRRDYKREQPQRYPSQRLDACLQTCARDLRRTPMVRDYVAWYEEVKTDVSCDRDAIPHYRTFYNHFGGWEAALASAGLPSNRRARTTTQLFRAVRSRSDKPDA